MPKISEEDMRKTVGHLSKLDYQPQAQKKEGTLKRVKRRAGEKISEYRERLRRWRAGGKGGRDVGVDRGVGEGLTKEELDRQRSPHVRKAEGK